MSQEEETGRVWRGMLIKIMDVGHLASLMFCFCPWKLFRGTDGADSGPAQQNSNMHVCMPRLNSNLIRHPPRYLNIITRESWESLFCSHSYKSTRLEKHLEALNGWNQLVFHCEVEKLLRETNKIWYHAVAYFCWPETPMTVQMLLWTTQRFGKRMRRGVWLSVGLIWNLTI